MKDQSSFFALLLEYWPLIGAIVAGIVGFTLLRSDVVQLQTEYATLQTSQTAYNSGQQQVLIQISQIQTDIQWIKDNLKNTKQ